MLSNPIGKAADAVTGSTPAATTTTTPTPVTKKHCCGGLSDEDKLGMIPDDKRKCRDIFCCTLFSLFWIGMIIIGAIGLKYGKWQRLLYGTDYKGQVCGSDISSKAYVTYPRTNEDFIANLGKTNPMDYKFYGICVSSCPDSLSIVCNYDIDENVVYTTSFKEQCLTDSNFNPSVPSCTPVRNGCWITPQRTSPIMFRCIPDYNVTNTEQSYCSYPAGVTDSSDPRCIIATDAKQGTIQRPAKPNLLFDQLNSGRQLWGRWFGDLARSWWVILIVAVGFALLCGFIWVTLLKYCTAFMVWATIYLVILLLSFLTGFFYYKAGLVNVELPQSMNDKFAAISNRGQELISTATAYVPQSWNENSDQYKLSYSAMAYISTGILIIVICLVVAMRNAIRTAVEVIKIGSDALRHMPLLTIFPCTNILTIGLFLVWWIFVAASLASAGQVTTADLADDVAVGLQTIQKEYGINATNTLANLPSINSTYTYIKDVPVLNYLMIYHIFGLLWTTQFIQGIATMTVAGSVCAWYFSQLPKANEGNPEMEKKRYNGSRWVIGSSLRRTLRYYLGSIAFGAFLIALIQAIRAVFAYIQRKLEPAAKNNSQLRFVLCCIQCCLACLQKAIEVVTRNAYIYTALKGESFCASGGRVFSLVRKHGSVFVLVNVLGEVIMFLGKATIAVASGWAGYVLLDNVADFKRGGKAELSSTWLPILVIVFFAYAVASGFMMIFDLSVDSVLVCYCTDVDENGVAIHFDKAKLDAKGKAKEKADAAAAKPGLFSSTPQPATGVAPKI